MKIQKQDIIPVEGVSKMTNCIFSEVIFVRDSHQHWPRPFRTRFCEKLQATSTHSILSPV